MKAKLKYLWSRLYYLFHPTYVEVGGKKYRVKAWTRQTVDFGKKRTLGTWYGEKK